MHPAVSTLRQRGICSREAVLESVQMLMRLLLSHRKMRGLAPKSPPCSREAAHVREGRGPVPRRIPHEPGVRGLEEVLHYHAQVKQHAHYFELACQVSHLTQQRWSSKIPLLDRAHEDSS